MFEPSIQMRHDLSRVVLILSDIEPESILFIPANLPVSVSQLVDFKHFSEVACDIVNDHDCGYPVYGRIDHKLAVVTARGIDRATRLITIVAA